jgi:septum formation topological specificity factor MinE
MILLAVVVSVFFKCRNCSVKFEVDLKCQKGAMSMLEMDVEMPEKSVHAGK